MIGIRVWAGDRNINRLTTIVCFVKVGRFGGKTVKDFDKVLILLGTTLTSCELSLITLSLASVSEYMKAVLLSVRQSPFKLLPHRNITGPHSYQQRYRLWSLERVQSV